MSMYVSALRMQPRLFSSVVACALLTGSAMHTGMEAGQRIPAKRVVLVAPFENLSTAKCMVVYEVATGSDPNNPKRSFRVDRYSEAPRGILEDIIGQVEGVSVVERQRIDTILLESEFGRLSGLVDPEKAVQLGKLLGANAIVMGSILDVRTTTRTFSGYAISTRNTAVKCSIRIRIIDIATGSVFSTITRGTAVYQASSFGGVNDSDVAYGVIESALETLRDNDAFKATISGHTTQSAAQPSQINGTQVNELVEVDFSPKPDNSDIELDGKYLGGSPLKRTVPTGTAIKVKISKAGYTPWEATIVPEKGMRVTTELQPVPIEPAK